MDALEWEGNKEWAEAQGRVWGPAKSPWGWGKEASGLTFLRVYQAGHAVAYDQPVVSLAMIHAFTRHVPVFS